MARETSFTFPVTFSCHIFHNISCHIFALRTVLGSPIPPRTASPSPSAGATVAAGWSRVMPALSYIWVRRCGLRCNTAAVDQREISDSSSDSVSHRLSQ